MYPSTDVILLLGIFRHENPQIGKNIKEVLFLDNDFLFYMMDYDVDLLSKEADLLGLFIANKIGSIVCRNFIHNELLRG